MGLVRSVVGILKVIIDGKILTQHLIDMCYQRVVLHLYPPKTEQLI